MVFVEESIENFEKHGFRGYFEQEKRDQKYPRKPCFLKFSILSSTKTIFPLGKNVSEVVSGSSVQSESPYIIPSTVGQNLFLIVSACAKPRLSQNSPQASLRP